MDQYKLCPFCGTQPIATVVPYVSGMWKGRLTCEECSLSVYVFGKTEGEALEMLAKQWNERYERTCHFDKVFNDIGFAVTWKCSECGKEHDGYMGFTPVNYCPFCGARKVDA